jgi:hypothetical protein
LAKFSTEAIWSWSFIYWKTFYFQFNLIIFICLICYVLMVQLW